MNLAPILALNDRRLLWLYVIALLLLLFIAGNQLINNTLTPAPVPRPVYTANPTTDGLISRYQDQLRQNPEHSYAYAGLGLAYLQKVRETGDAAYYALADDALQAALEREPAQFEALLGRGQLALARHDFTTALEWGAKAQNINPYRAEPLGILVDAYVELGQYDAAAKTADAMVNLRPGLESYSRVSYIRELNGDTAGAIEAMAAAANAGRPGAEGTLWARTHLGNLSFNSGDWTAAKETYKAVLAQDSDYPYALAGMAQAQAAEGDIDAAIATLAPLVERRPEPAFALLLGDLYSAAGQPEAAAAQYELVRTFQQLNAAAGMNVDRELALFEAEQGNPEAALEMARNAYAQRPGIYAADALAWALYHNGRYVAARAYSLEALRLGTNDATLHFHAGMIAAALGDLESARTHLEEALTINPAFSVLDAPQAEQMLNNP